MSRLIQVSHIDELIAARIRNAINTDNSRAKTRQCRRQPWHVWPSPDELNREQKWQWMLSKAQRK